MAIKASRLGPDREVNNLNGVEVVNGSWDPAFPTATAIGKGSVVFVSGIQGAKLTVQKTTQTHVAATDGFVMVAEHELRESGRCTTGWAIVDLDTSAAAINDPVYLALSGAVELSGAGGAQVGHVLTVGTDGKVLLNPRMVP